MRFNWEFLLVFVIDSPLCKEHGNIIFKNIRFNWEFLLVFVIDSPLCKEHGNIIFKNIVVQKML